MTAGHEHHKTVSIHNLGCKVNSCEAEAVEKLLSGAGYRIVPFSEKADVVIINTCTVTAVADKKSRQMLHRAKTLNPDAVVIAMGCYAETGREKLSADTGVDLIIGNNRKKDILSILDAWFSDHEKQAWYDDIARKGAEYEEWNQVNHGDVVPAVHTRAFVKIQDGCDRFCTYCIIPYARGRIRSRKSESVLEEVKRCAENGVLEIVLTGIHVSSYGRDAGADCDLLTLIGKIHPVEGIRRIRLSSIEPGIVTEDFARRLASMEKICPHFHLSLQSGCDATLKRMNRSYTAAEYAEKCAILRKYFDRPALTTDVIAGFPGETEEEFEQSFAFVKSIGFFETHIFPYSRRRGTLADKMPGQLPERVKKERVKRLLELNEAQRQRFLDQFAGEDREVLFEEQEEEDGMLYWTGHTARYEKIRYQSDEDLRNKMKVLTEAQAHKI